MSLSFTPSRAGIAYWWSNAWRAFVIMLMFFLPIAVLYFVLGLAYIAVVMGVMRLGIAWLATAVVITVSTLSALLPLVLNYVVFPIFAQAFAVRWMSRKTRIGKYTFAATYNGQPTTTFRPALRFAAFTYLENLKYIWPLFIFGGLLGYASHVVVPATLTLAVIGISFLPLAVYVQILVLTDLLHRGTYSKNRCTLSFIKTSAVTE